MSTQNFAPEFLATLMGDPAALCRLTDEVTVLSTHLAAEPSHCTRQELTDIRDNLNTLALVIARIKRLVSERIATLTAGGLNGD